MAAAKTLCLATQNKGKVFELRELFELNAPELLSQLNIVSLADLGVTDEPIEDGVDFEANALIKAKAAYASTGQLSLADDSGLEVTALGGAPGLYSARYGGPPKPGQSRDARNREKLREAMRDVAVPDRQARFVCVLCLYGELDDSGQPTVIMRRGECTGHLLFEDRGDNGFGYDPLFIPEPHELTAAGLPQDLIDRTFAEMTSPQKSRLSHRARALCNMLGDLRAQAAR